MAVNAEGLLRALRSMTVDLDQRLADRFGDQVEANAPRRTGELAGSVEIGRAVPTGSGAQCSATVTARHAVWQEEGTGIYGPSGTPITPKSGRVLRFDWPSAGGVVFATRVAGSPPTHFWTRAVESWSSIVSSVG